MKVRKLKKDRLTHLEITALIDKHMMSEVNRLNKLDDYYDNKNTVINSRTSEPNKPNNKISNPYAYYITSMCTGYFMGKPVKYELDKTYQEVVEKIFNFNDETDVNNTLATNCSKYGWAVEHVFVDENANFRFAPCDNREIIYLVNTDVLENTWCVIRHWKDIDLATDLIFTTVEVYYNDEIHRYSYDGDGIILGDPEIKLNPFKDIPFIIYHNNDSNLGDYELVIPLIDAYDKTQSDTANDFEYFTDCYLQISGVTVDEEEAKKLKQLKVFNFPDVNGGVKFITKDINDTALENYKARINSDIHKFSMIPDMSDKEFSANSSGVSLKYKLQGLDYLCAIKESKFRKGLLRRIELMNNLLNLRSSVEVDLISDTYIIFTRNTIDNLVEIVEMVNSLTGIISEESQFDMLPFISTNKEIERKRKEEEVNPLTGDDFFIKESEEEEQRFGNMTKQEMTSGVSEEELTEESTEE